MMATNAHNNDPIRCVLEGVPRVGFYPDQQKHEDSKSRCPEDVCFPSCLRACLEYLGEGLGCWKIGASRPQRGMPRQRTTWRRRCGMSSR